VFDFQEPFVFVVVAAAVVVAVVVDEYEIVESLTCVVLLVDAKHI